MQFHRRSLTKAAFFYACMCVGAPLAHGQVVLRQETTTTTLIMPAEPTIPERQMVNLACLSARGDDTVHVQMTVTPDHRIVAFAVLHETGGSTYDRAAQYVGSHWAQQPGRWDVAWNGWQAKDRRHFMEGRAFVGTDSRWYYTETSLMNLQSAGITTFGPCY
jgi:hypothetical protein